ncbi:MAG: helix-turn-helix domain-containing protein [Syntrophaceae bacterium]|nr:helix-turn-helix domain-containing protein [Syntrophaceae bacterium]
MFVEKTPTDGLQKLTAKRESMGLSLNDVFKKIRIKAGYLKNIENSEFHLLPDPVYTKNFIKIYARFLGVDEVPILKDYEAYLNAQKEELIPPRKTSQEEKSFFASVVSNKNYWGIFFVFITVFVVWLILKQNPPVSEGINSSKRIDIPAKEIMEQNVSSSSNTTSVVNSSPNVTFKDPQQMITDPILQLSEFEKGTSGNVLKQTANMDNSVKKNASLPLSLETKHVASVGSQKSNLLIIASQETWIRVKGGESTPVQILLKPGEKFESNAETFNLDIGNAGGIRIKYKNKDVENLGKPGEVVHLRLP